MYQSFLRDVAVPLTTRNPPEFSQCPKGGLERRLFQIKPSPLLQDWYSTRRVGLQGVVYSSVREVEEAFGPLPARACKLVHASSCCSLQVGRSHSISYRGLLHKPHFVLENSCRCESARVRWVCDCLDPLAWCMIPRPSARGSAGCFNSITCWRLSHTPS